MSLHIQSLMAEEIRLAPNGLVRLILACADCGKKFKSALSVPLPKCRCWMTSIDTGIMPCGHPESAVEGRTTKWCGICAKEASKS